MKFSPETIKVLNNFAAINPNFVFGNGETITTISEARNVMASAKIKESTQIDEPIGIYDLKQFLNCLSLVENHELDIHDKYVLIKSGRTSIKYYLTDLENLLFPSKQINMPPADLTFDFKQSDMDRVQKAASTLGHKQMIISSNNGGTATVTVGEAKNKTANTFEYELPAAAGSALNHEFEFIFTIPTLNLLPGDYRVSVSSKLISQFTKNDVTYWIGLDKASTYKEV